VVGGTVAAPLKALVTGPSGEPIQGASVSFTISSGYGFLSNPSGVTDAQGEFSPGAWELSEPGAHSLTSVVSGVPSLQPTALVNAAARDLAWTPQVTPGENIGSIWGTSPSALFSSGGHRTLNFWDGGAWTAMPHPSGSARFRVHGRSLTDVYSVGQWGAIHFDGSAWSESLNSGTELFGIWTAPDGQAFASGDGTFWHFDGSGWSQKATGLSTAFNDDRLENVWGSSSSNVYVVGRKGIVLRWDGFSVQRVNTGFSESAFSVFGFGPNDVYVTDDIGVIHFDGTSWTRVAIGAVGEVPIGIWGSSPRNVYASTRAGRVWRFDGRSWQVTATFGTSLSAMFGFDPAHVYVGTDGSPGLIHAGS